MHVKWTDVLTVASPLLALLSAVIACRSTRLARRSLDIAIRTGQANYEVAKGSLIPAVSLFLTEIEYRRVPVSNVEPDSFEVVIRGRLVNNTQHEVLLTCHDHPNSGRDWWQPLYNESVSLSMPLASIRPRKRRTMQERA
jgi:hypothetical protein